MGSLVERGEADHQQPSVDVRGRGDEHPYTAETTTRPWEYRMSQGAFAHPLWTGFKNDAQIVSWN
jgi:hypothetical protein